MGIKLFSSSSFEERPQQPDYNPDPSNYKIIKVKILGEYTVIKINYPDCKNHEGNKVLLFKATMKQLERQKRIDPHFSNSSKYISPIARFQPTKEGWNDAVNFIKYLK